MFREGKETDLILGVRKSKMLSFIVPLFLALSSLVFGTTTLDEKGKEKEDGSFVVCLLIPQRIYIFPPLPLTSFVNLPFTDASE